MPRNDTQTLRERVASLAANARERRDKSNAEIEKLTWEVARIFGPIKILNEEGQTVSQKETITIEAFTTFTYGEGKTGYNFLTVDKKKFGCFSQSVIPLLIKAKETGSPIAVEYKTTQKGEYINHTITTCEGAPKKQYSSGGMSDKQMSVLIGAVFAAAGVAVTETGLAMMQDNAKQVMPFIKE